MNWIDFVLIALLLTAIIVGSKKGLVREISAFVVFFAAIILTVNYVDVFAVWVYDRIGGSPLISAFISFTLLAAASYGFFKLLAWIFYKVASIKSQGKQDQVGGAIVGFFRGWVMIGFLTFVVFFLPLPDNFYTTFDGSFLGKLAAKTVPLMYEGTKMMHPANPTFMGKVENTLLGAQAKGKPSSGKGEMGNDREQVYRVMYQIDRFFNISSGT
ncbi:MAG: CvpA family protein [Candidatus Zixiibacteriota bacterium]